MNRFPLLIPVALVGLAGCATTVGLEATPYASDPTCATMLLATPDEVSGFERSKTTAQATTAWGEGASFRCGLESPTPSTDRCITVGGIDWLSLDSSDPRIPQNGGDGTWTFISYGRVPTVEVVISTEAVGAGTVTDVLTAFTPAMSQATVERECVGLTDAPLVLDEGEADDGTGDENAIPGEDATRDVDPSAEELATNESTED